MIGPIGAPAVATAHAKLGAPAATVANLDTIPSSIQTQRYSNDPHDAYDAHAAVTSTQDSPDDKVDYPDEYPIRGLVLEAEDGNDWKPAPIKQLAPGSSLDAAIAAAAQFSTEVASVDDWSNGTVHPAIGVFDAGQGQLLLGNLWWNHPNNGDSIPVAIEAGDSAERLSPQLVAVVSDTAVALFQP